MDNSVNCINSYQVLNSIATAIDISENNLASAHEIVEPVSNIEFNKHRFLYHTRRTTYIALRLASAISNDDYFKRSVYVSSMLHDIGTFEANDNKYTMGNYILQHVVNGEKLISKIPPEAVKNFITTQNIAQNIKYHHENFNGSGPFSLKNQEIPIISQIIRISDLLELIYSDTLPYYLQQEKINKWVLTNKGKIFSHDIIDIYLQVQKNEGFWCDLENICFFPEILNKNIPNYSIHTDINTLKTISIVFAEVIDAKSSFTFKHSYNLYKIIEKISEYLGFQKEKKIRYEVAALLHDLGKLAIPNSILSKQGKLNQIETNIIRSHTYYTRLILSCIDGIEDITNWASNHHEKLNGTGYPLRLKGEDLSLEDRIMSICDIYEALTSTRPYKKGMNSESAFKIIESYVEKGELCEKAYDIVKNALL